MTGEVIGVVGLGVMGLGIAQVYAQAGYLVRATDGWAAARESAPLRWRDALGARVAAGKMTAAAANATWAALQIVETPADIGPADLVIEAIVEDLAAKRTLFASLEKTGGVGTVLASNTSSLSIAGLAAGLARPDRVIGLHFFNPVAVMKLVELAGHKGTAPEALALARSVTEGAGKTVIACADRPGFIVNRCARPFYGEALAMLEEGRSAFDIDAAMLAAGYPLGPLSLIDLVGADVNLAATEGLYQAMGRHPRYYPFDRLRAQVATGNLGRKTGRGFVHPNQPGKPPADAGAIAARIEAALANEAATLVAEGGVCANDVDTAMRLGLNFPRGPFESLRRRGLAPVLAQLAQLEAAAPTHLRGRYVAAGNLKDLA